MRMGLEVEAFQACSLQALQPPGRTAILLRRSRRLHLRYQMPSSSAGL